MTDSLGPFDDTEQECSSHSTSEDQHAPPTSPVIVNYGVLDDEGVDVDVLSPPILDADLDDSDNAEPLVGDTDSSNVSGMFSLPCLLSSHLIFIISTEHGLEVPALASPQRDLMVSKVPASATALPMALESQCLPFAHIFQADKLILTFVSVASIQSASVAVVLMGRGARRAGKRKPIERRCNCDCDVTQEQKDSLQAIWCSVKGCETGWVRVICLILFPLLNSLP